MGSSPSSRWHRSPFLQPSRGSLSLAAKPRLQQLRLTDRSLSSSHWSLRRAVLREVRTGQVASGRVFGGVGRGRGRNETASRRKVTEREGFVARNCRRQVRGRSFLCVLALPFVDVVRGGGRWRGGHSSSVPRCRVFDRFVFLANAIESGGWD